MFAQLYIYDLNEAIATQRQRNKKVHLETILALQQMLLEYNNFIPLMKQSYETLHTKCENDNNNLSLAMHLQYEYGRQTRHSNL